MDSREAGSTESSHGPPSHLEPVQKKIRRSYVCQTCDTCYTEKRSLERHLQTVAHCTKVGKSATELECEFCGKRFARLDHLRRHEKKVHERVHQNSIEGSHESNPVITTPHNHVTSDVARQIVNRGRTLDEPLVEGLAISTEVVEAGWDVPVGKPITGLPYYQEDHLSYTMANSQTYCGTGTSSRASTEISRNPISDFSSQSDNITDCGFVLVSAPMTYTDTAKEALETASVAQNQVQTETAKESQPQSATVPRGENFELPLRPYPLLKKGGASLRPGVTKRLPRCPTCKKPFGSTGREIVAHIDQHMKELNGEHICHRCDVGFVHRVDLERHEQSASRGHCGFQFEHQYQCTGHHPPDEFEEFVSKRDRMKLCYQLRNWEQSQLQVLIRELGLVARLRAGSLSDDCWSVGAPRVAPESVADTVGHDSAPTVCLERENIDINMPSLPPKVEHQNIEVTDSTCHPTAVSLLLDESSASMLNRLIPKKVRSVDLDRLRLFLSRRLSPYLRDLVDRKPWETDFHLSLKIIARPSNVELLIQLSSVEVDLSDNRCYSHNDTPVYAATSAGNINLSKVIILKRPKVSGKRYDPKCGTPLCATASIGDLEAMKLLIAWGSDVNGKGCPSYCGGPLSAAALAGDVDAMKLLIAHGADVNCNAGAGSALLMAITANNVGAIKLLSHSGASMSAISSRVLRVAIIDGRHDLIKTLLDCGMDVNSADWDGRTLLTTAVTASQYEIAETLLAYGADPMIRELTNLCAMCTAKLLDCGKIVALLLRHGANNRIRVDCDGSCKWESCAEDGEWRGIGDQYLMH